MTRRDLESIPAIALVILLGSSCFSEPVYENRSCSSIQECPGGLVCASTGRCLRACVTPEQCNSGETCQEGACVAPGAGIDGSTGSTDAGSADAAAEANCAACDAPSRTCIDGDSVFRTYVNLGACPGDPSQCAYAVLDVACPSCTDACLTPCSDQTCDELEGGCRRAGYCVPDPTGPGVACAYVPQVDTATCTGPSGESGACRGGVCLACQGDEACDDGDACTENDSCRGGQCIGDPVTCDDGNACTDDTCDRELGCVFTDNDDPCSDGDLCTHSDQCSNGTCAGTAITCSDDACTMRACDGTPSCAEQPVPSGTPCPDDGLACTRDVCDGAGTCTHPGLPDGAQCGAAQSQRCCNVECVDISRDARHCGGCGTACDPGFGCEPIESTPSCGASYPAQVSGRCLCQGANSHCPDNRGQVCRLTTFLDGNRCVPDSTTAMPCASGQRVQVINMCPGYCAY